ncbi:MAG: phenylalanine--tRNA ligase subunit beta [Pyrinomonadaceae bacterium]|nr:phenylalanine--tRNA ligase subunit beta [Pyrinomonadaceae bacterium]
MLISTEWIKDFVEWDSDLKLLQQLLNNRVSEVEAVESFGAEKDFSQIVVGQVVKINSNEGTDLADVNIGGKTIQVPVNGDVVEGKKYAVALEGANLPVSQDLVEWLDSSPAEKGIFCSERDLKLGESGALVVISDDVDVSTEVYKALSLNDTVFHFDLEPHRPDLFSHLGFAREVAALHGTRIRNLQTAELRWVNESEGRQFKLNVEAPELVNRYAAVKLKNVQVGSSPQWIKNRLRSVGLRPRNNVVDITNYVMLEYGQPLHTFDYSQIGGQTITLRRARAGEKMTALDGKEHTLDEEVLLVADSEKAVAIAGIIGGENSGITDATTEVLLESANFNMTSVRRTSRTYAVRTDASLRFEKGPDPNLVREALERAVLLLQKYAGAEVEGDVLDYYPKTNEPKKLSVSLAKLNDYLGSDISLSEAEKILHGLEFQTEPVDSQTIVVSVPTFRPDVSIFEDIVEEVGRIYGYDNIPYTLPSGTINPVIGDENTVWQNFCKSELIRCGFTELRTDPWMGSEDVESLGLASDRLLEVQNYISLSQNYLRTSPFPSLLNVIGESLKKHDYIKVFELSKTYEKQFDDELKKVSPADEKYFLAGAVTLGNKKFKEGDEFYHLKSALNFLFESGNIDDVQIIPAVEEKNELLTAHCGSNLFEKGADLEILIDGKAVGSMGYLSKAVSAKYGIKAVTVVFFLSFDRLVGYFKPWRRYQQPSKMPSVHFDINLLVDDRTLVGDLQQFIKDELGEILVKLQTVDVYLKTGIDGKKSVTFSLEFNSPTHSLLKEDIQRKLDGVIESLANRFGAELRSK